MKSKTSNQYTTRIHFAFQCRVWIEYHQTFNRCLNIMMKYLSLVFYIMAAHNAKIKQGPILKIAKLLHHGT